MSAIFSDIRSELKSELTFRHEHRTANAKLACEMRVGESVAVHVRQLHGVPAGSQQPAVGIEGLPVSTTRGDSENQRACALREVLRLQRLSITVRAFDSGRRDGAGRERGDDAHTKISAHEPVPAFVLANSTFSWWGAWLGRSRESIVVSPVMHEWGQIARLPDEWNAIEWHRASQKDDSPCCERKTCRMDIGA